MLLNLYVCIIKIVRYLVGFYMNVVYRWFMREGGDL